MNQNLFNNLIVLLSVDTIENYIPVTKASLLKYIAWEGCRGAFARRENPSQKCLKHWNTEHEDWKSLSLVLWLSTKHELGTVQLRTSVFSQAEGTQGST